jgi:hypothetical protein
MGCPLIKEKKGNAKEMDYTTNRENNKMQLDYAKLSRLPNFCVLRPLLNKG